MLLAVTTQSRGQVKGEVETIGFQNYYRSDCWTQMVVRLTPQTDKASDYLIRVHQEDMDRDRPIFTRLITVTGMTEAGGAQEQRFRLYFKPSPTGTGLPDRSDANQTLSMLQKRLSVELTTTAGKFIATLPITNTIANMDPYETHRSQKMILAVSGGRSAASHAEYDRRLTIGLLEDVAMIDVHIDDLPENPLGYDAVDGIVWLDADPGLLSNGGDEKLRALQTYVRRGGHLVICQPAEQWQKTLGFGDLLPVVLQGVQQKKDAEPLRSLAKPLRDYSLVSDHVVSDPWSAMLGPMTLGVASIKPGGIVDEWIDWGDPKLGLTPYIARNTYGAGCVTWVAQDLGDPSVTTVNLRGERTATNHWPLIWNRVFGWQDNPLLLSDPLSEDDKAEYNEDRVTPVNTGMSLIDGVMELPGKSLGYIAVALVFFVVYWLVAGPGASYFLWKREQLGASWFVFAAAAIVFTPLTIVLARVLVRGPPQLRHFSVVRSPQNQPVDVYSRFGLYIPRTDEETLELKDAAPGAVADLTTFAIPPTILKDSAPDDIGPEYQVPVSDTPTGESSVLHVGYRSTLKKFEADWTGDRAAAGLNGGIEGIAKLADPGTFIDGKLTNGTGRRLREIYIAFKWHSPANESNVRNNGNWMLYIPSWDPGTTLDLSHEFKYSTDADGKDHYLYNLSSSGSAKPQNGKKVRGRIQDDWQPFWLSTVDMNSQIDFQNSAVMTTFFGQIPPDKKKDNRIDLLRLGARRFDISAALTAGSMVVLAQADPDKPNPLPQPLQVDGDPVGGNGATIYQFIVPMDNTFANTPATQPAGN